MKTKNKALLLSLCAVLLVAATVLCTIAWLTAEQTVTNTFTYGKVAIELKEPKTDAFGEYYYRDDTTTEESCDPESYFYYEVKALLQTHTPFARLMNTSNVPTSKFAKAPNRAICSSRSKTSLQVSQRTKKVTTP